MPKIRRLSFELTGDIRGQLGDPKSRGCVLPDLRLFATE